jgi:antitoxin MazE
MTPRPESHAARFPWLGALVLGVFACGCERTPTPAASASRSAAPVAPATSSAGEALEPAPEATPLPTDMPCWTSSSGATTWAFACPPRAREARLRVNQRVRVSVEGDQVVIRPVDDSRLTLEQRLAAFDPKRHGGERMASARALGAERW